MKNAFLCISFLSISFLASQVLYGQSPTNVKLPIDLPGGETKPLRSYEDSDFEAALIKKMNGNAKWKKLIAQKQMSVGLVDLRDINNIKFASVNGDEMMYAASLPKIAVLLAMMDAFEKGEITETEAIKNDLNLMIGKSNNAATTRMIDMLGYDKIEEVLTDPKYELYDKEYGGGLWVGKRYASTGERNPDPIKGISHAATASQVCRYYYLMAFGQLVTKERSAQMLEIMDDPKLHHKFVNSLDKVAPKAKVFRKSGSWRTFHSDSVLVWGPKRRYILVALINDPDGENILRQLVVSVEDLMKF